MASPWQTLAEAIAEQVSGIANIGRVHRRTRYLKDRASFLEAVRSTDAQGRTILRAWFVEPGQPMIATGLEGFGMEVAAAHTVNARVVGLQPVHEDPDGEGSYDELEALGWEVKRTLDSWQPQLLPGFDAILLTTAATIGAPEMRVLPTGELAWVVTVERAFVCTESSFDLEV